MYEKCLFTVAAERFISELQLHLQQAFLLWFSSWDSLVFSCTKEELPPVWPGCPVPHILDRMVAVVFCWLRCCALLRYYLGAAYCLSLSFLEDILHGINEHNCFAITIYLQEKKWLQKSGVSPEMGESCRKAEWTNESKPSRINDLPVYFLLFYFNAVLKPGGQFLLGKGCGFFWQCFWSRHGIHSTCLFQPCLWCL